MQIEFEVKEKEGLKREIEVSVPAQMLEPQIEKALRDYQKKATLEGFRKGKVPIPLIRKMYGEAIAYDAVEKSIDEFYGQAMREADLNPAGQASIVDMSYQPGSDMKFKAEFEVMPEVSGVLLDGIEVEKDIMEIDDEDVESMLDRMREEHAMYETVEGEAEIGHILTVDIQETDDSGFPLVGHRYEDRNLELGHAGLGEEVTQQLVGVKVDETVRVVFDRGPTQSGGEAQAAFWQVTVKSIQKKVLPELDDEFAKDLGDVDTLAELREQMRKQLESGWEREANKVLGDRVIREVVQRNTVDIPEIMLKGYLDDMAGSAKTEDGQPVNAEAFKENYRDQALFNLRWFMLQEKLIADMAIEVSDEQVREHIEEMASRDEPNAANIRKYYRDKGRQRRLKDNMVNDKLMAALLERVTIKERQVSAAERRRGDQIVAPV